MPTLSAIVAALALALPHDSIPDGHAGARWTPIVAYDEVRVDLDTARLERRGAVSAWLRWHYLDRASSPGAWDAGVRSSIDRLEVDCARTAARTVASTAFDAAGHARAELSLDAPDAAWRLLVPGTVGAEVAERVCAAAHATPAA